MPRRILLLNERDPEHPRAGGAEVHVARIFSRLAARGHDVTWYATRAAGAARTASIDGLTIERRRPLPAYYASVPLRVRRAARSGGFDLVVECLNKLPYYAPLYSGIPVLAVCHHLFGEVAYEQVSFPIATGVVLAESGIARAYRDVPFLAISESTRQDLIGRGIDPSHVVVSTPGVDPPTIRVDPDAARPARATYVGRLEPYKRVDLLLRAGALLTRRFPDLELLVIGKGSDRPRLEKLARELGVAERTRFTGFVTAPERDALLAGSRVCAFPSEKEGWGLTVIEANALGTPVVARDAPGLRDSIRHEQTGLLVPPDSPVAPGARAEQEERPDEATRYAEAMATLLREDDRARTLRRACLAWSERFDWDRAALDIEQAVERAIAGAYE